MEDNLPIELENTVNESPPLPNSELTLEEKEKEIIEILGINYSYDVPTNKEIIHKIYELFKNDIIDEECIDSDYLTYLGFYTGHNKGDLNKQIFLYRKASELGNVHAMYNLGLYYQEIEKFNLSKKYFKMAIRKGDCESMLGYGCLLLYDNRDINGAKRYFNLAKKNNYYRGYYEMAYYYCEFKFNFKKLKENVLLFLDTYEIDLERYNDESKMRKISLIKLLGIIFTYDIEDNINYLLPYFTKFNIEDSSHKLQKYNDKINMRKQYITNKKKIKKECDTCYEEKKIHEFNCLEHNKECGICYEEKELYIFDCMEHYTCLDCYSKVSKCPFCSIEKHQIMKTKTLIEIIDEEIIVEDYISDDDDLLEDEEIYNTSNNIIINGQISGQISGQTNEETNEQTNIQTNEETNEENNYDEDDEEYDNEDEDYDEVDDDYDEVDDEDYDDISDLDQINFIDNESTDSIE